MTDADIFEIEPVVPYPVDYYETIDVARKESSEDARPQIKGELPDLSNYETVIIGSTIWNGAPPMIMHTFYEALPGLAEKTLVPFGTHGGSEVIGIVYNLSEKNEGYSIKTNGACLYIDNLPQGTPIFVFDIMGKTIYSGKEHQINVEKSGMYLVKANNATKKVMVQ